MYCKKCGGKVDSYASHCPFCGEPIASGSTQVTYSASSDEAKPATKGVWSWILTYIVMCIPVLNIIMLLVWSFAGKTKANPTFRNWARAVLLLEIISVALIVIGSVLITILAPELAEKYLEALEEYR